MEGGGKGAWATLVILAALAASGSSYQIIDGPKNLTVLAGSEARFNCTVSQGWKLIMWALNGTVVLSLTPSEPIITNERFTSASYQVDGNFVSEMVIHDVQLNDSGRIRCSLQNSDLDATAFLQVQVMGDLHIPGDSLRVVEDEPCNVTCRASGWTPLPHISWEVGVPVSHSSYFSTPEPGDLQSAVSILTLTPQGNGTLTCVAAMRSVQADKTVSANLTVVPPPPGSIDKPGTSLPTWAIVLLAVSLSLLLILIIVLIIIFCCCCVSGKEKKESSYQSEIRKSAQAKTNKGTSEPNLKSGNENPGYSSDEPRTAGAASRPPRSGELRVPEPQSSSHHHQDPDPHWPRSEGRPQLSVHAAGPWKVRNVTLV
ncbi:immunoglobulin superfamily member 5 isoform X1 [Lepus europaeus]|uniref:immunoglobulin superfamily member 5 isoform X1 n=1 Tax=Lepus europaeus TaxID=9983 RepID=UPI002B47C36D|nr:immunoglobulin superfamily member 5 isoform X1 [Lepus europaeus]